MNKVYFQSLIINSKCFKQQLQSVSFQMSLQAIKSQIALLKSPQKANQMMRFFKTAPGQYGAGDIFAGLTNPQCRQIAQTNKFIDLESVQNLLGSQVHEERFIALVILDLKFKKKEEREQIYNLYVKNLKYINNWDLVDLSAPNILGNYIYQNCKTFQEINSPHDPRAILYKLVEGSTIWERRISIISTLTFIRNGQFYDTFKISQKLLGDKEDLIHKAVGWMLREVGKRDLKLLQVFLQEHYQKIPRTSLRYAIQRFGEKRVKYLKGEFIKDI